MKIALLTIWHEKNYGAELQAYATIKVLQNLGHEVEMIDIRLSDCINSNLNSKINRVVTFYSPCNRKFNAFWNKYIPKTRRYRSLKEIQSNPPIADVYLVGSDQVWNPDITKSFSELYFLNFGATDVKRISYASSFGADNWQFDTLTNNVRQLLERFNSISCREDSGVDILNNVFKQKAFSVIDPTLLLGEFSELTGKPNHRNSLVFYPLDIDPELEVVATRLAKELNLDLVNNNKKKYICNKLLWDRISVEDWVKNIAEAEFVITRSFHGLMFSLIYQKQFVVIANTFGRNTRLESIMKKLGLTDRLYTSFDQLFVEKPWYKKIDYDIITPRIKNLRSESLDFLKYALK